MTSKKSTPKPKTDRLELRYVDLDELRRWSSNPKRHDTGQIVESIKKYGFKDPPKWETTLNKGKGGLVEGNGRDEALLWMKKFDPDNPPRGILLDEGRWLVPVLFGVDAQSQAAAEAYAVDHNNLVMSGSEMTAVDMAEIWDLESYNAVLQKLAKQGQFAISVDSDDVDLLNKLVNPVDSKDLETQMDPDRFEELKNKWNTAEGQLWKIGGHFIYCGDSLETENIEKVLQGQKPVLVIADPPYGINIVAANESVGGGENKDGIIPFGGGKRVSRRGTVGASKPFGSKSVRGSDGAAHVVEVGKYPVVIGDESTDTAKQAVTLYLEKFPDANHVWWGANYYIESLRPSPCWVVWNKETTGNFADCELAWSNVKMPAKLFTHRWSGMLRDSEREKRWHPTQKPAALAEFCYSLFTQKGDIVLDPFGGAGWTLLAAEADGRKACIIEKSPEYIAVQLERMTITFPYIKVARIE